MQKTSFVQGTNSINNLPYHYENLKVAAKAKLPTAFFDYIESGASYEETLSKNEAAFQKYSIVPRFLHDVSNQNTSINLFGKTYAHPFLLAPVGMLKLAHDNADLAVAKAAKKCNVPFIQSTVSTHSLEEVTKEVPDSSKWFQLYWSKDQTVSYSMVERAEKLGYEAIVVTVDTVMLGYRVKDKENNFSPLKMGFGKANYINDQAFQRSLSAQTDEAVINKIVENLYHPHLNWDHIAQLKAKTSLPVILKGILHPEDAKLACDNGIDGIIVSNHGGRQLDGVTATIDALAPIVNAVAGQIPILLDSGIRSGTDIIKALALGADAVLIGRPFIYGLAAAGQSGVEQVLDNFIQETTVALSLAGVSTINEAKQIKVQT